MGFLLFVIAIIVIGVATIKQKRKNREKFHLAWQELLNAQNDSEESTGTVDDTVIFPKAEMEDTAKTAATRSCVMREPRNADEIIVPLDFLLREEMETLLYLAKQYPDEVTVDVYPPADRTEIAAFEERTGIRLTQEQKTFYQFANGLTVCNGTLELESLEVIENLYKTGYCDWKEEGDADDYVMIGSVIGDGEYLIMEKKTGHIFWHDEGEMTDYETVRNLLDWVIDFEYDGYCRDEAEDERIKAYLDRRI